MPNNSDDIASSKNRVTQPCTIFKKKKKKKHTNSLNKANYFIYDKTP
jgi:hypothetical protein